MSFIEIRSHQYQGLEKKEIRVQGIKTRGMSQLSLSGNLSSSLRDSRDKIKAVVARFAPWGPLDKILLNLLPSDLSKFSPQLEVPMALATLALLWPESLRDDQQERLNAFQYSGAVALSGALVDSQMILGSGETVGAFKSLEELWVFVLDGELPVQEPAEPRRYHKVRSPRAEGRDYEKFWLQVAADARVPVLLIGPPGIGKSHLARWALSCLSSPEEMLRDEIDRIWTLAGHELIPQVPFQNPHSRTHLSEFVGVSRHDIPRPGLFTLAHGGLLVLDEFPELARDCREILRNILDEKMVLKNTRAGFSQWPADFWLIMTANPCPCGLARGRDLSRCRCPEKHRQAYLARFSGPLLDRVGVKLFLREGSPPLPSALRLQEGSPLEFPEGVFDFPWSPRERSLVAKLWAAYSSQVAMDDLARRFFADFLLTQKSFAKDWLVHGYE